MENIVESTKSSKKFFVLLGIFVLFAILALMCFIAFAYYAFNGESLFPLFFLSIVFGLSSWRLCTPSQKLRKQNKKNPLIIMMAGLFLRKELTGYSRFDCTFENSVSVTPKNAEREPSSPDITSGISSFRITIVNPKPSALKIPITFVHYGGKPCSTTRLGDIKCIHSLPESMRQISDQCGRILCRSLAGRVKQRLYL